MLQELIEKRAELDKQITEAKKAALADAHMRALVCFTNAGFTLDEARKHMHQVSKSTVKKLPKSKQPALYRHVATGETWSGRGRKPKWFLNATSQEELQFLGAT